MFGTTYQWKDGSRIPVDAQLAGEAIEILRRKANGLLTPAQVVDAARVESSVLHPAFEWNDAEAAEKHREDQARGLIRALVVRAKPNGVEREVRAFVSVTKTTAQDAENEDQQQTGYISLSAAIGDAELRRQVLERAWNELEQWRRRYENYYEIVAWFEAAEAARRAA